MPDDKRQKKLTDVQREFILRCLALGFGLQDTADFVKDEFDVDVSRQNVAYYQENHGERIEELRQELAADIERIPFANKVRRLAYLDRIAQKQYRRRQYPEFRATLKQIAEEVGAIVHKHEHSGANGGPIQTTTTALSIEELMKLDPAELARQHTDALDRSRRS